MDFGTLDIFARILHVASVLVWVGHNWANVISQPRYRRVLPDAPGEAIRDLFVAASKREHATFRYASLLALGTGLWMLWSNGVLFDALLLQRNFALLGAGVWLALLMVANLWFVLWPYQKKVLGFVPATTEERLRYTRITFLSSRTNTILSIPTLSFMVAGAHGGGPF